MQIHQVIANGCGRLDKVLTSALPDISRARVQAIIASGGVKVNDKTILSASHKVYEGDALHLEMPPPKPAQPAPQNIDIDIVFEDDNILVINKQSGLVVHPAAGNYDGTLVNALLFHCKNSLSGIGGVARPGIVHRLDKDTSGLMLVAKTDAAHAHLSSQLSKRTVKREYMALVFGTPTLLAGTVDAPIARDPNNRLKMSVRRDGKHAKTHWKVESVKPPFSLLTCRLESGRTHQIRVHMNHIKMPIVGDPLYGAQKTAVASGLRKAGIDEDAFLNFARQALHAKSISFIHPQTENEMHFDAAPPMDFKGLLDVLKIKYSHST